MQSQELLHIRETLSRACGGIEQLIEAVERGCELKTKTIDSSAQSPGAPLEW